MTNNYELVVLLDSKLEASGQTKTIEEIKAIVEKDGGSLVEKTDWGKKQLAYPINKQDSANFFLIKLNGAPEIITNLNFKLKHNENILRYLLVKSGSSLKKGRKNGPKIAK